MRRAVLSGMLAVCLGVGALAPARSQGPARVSSEGGRVAVRLTEKERARIGVVTARLAAQPHRIEILAYASVLDPARITDLANSYAGAVAALRTARARAEVSAGALRRARSLGATVVSGAQRETVEGTAATDEAAVAAAESQVRTLAATAQQEWGSVLGRGIVERSSLVTRLIERADLLVQVTLPSGEAMKPPPATAAAEVPPQSDRMTLRLVSPATRADQRIQGLSYFYLAAGDSGLLPGMSVQAFLTSPQEAVGIAVPESAVVHWQGRAWIYRAVGPDTFARHPLKPDAAISADRSVVDDLGEAAEVVVTGPQALLTEELKGQVQASGDADDD
ncbi:multidrug transporter [Methylobacterium indicum]|uniref:Multidrug transporter n=2 Tax=Methylobacterium indicum TaxID=1775910 RepID=A0A0J6RW61_9HYPH|nr:multidrug transporter [Methylobacterium indicum]KMO25567.1 multidrug transporter [Methylobacterium indicum]KTS38680.1 multidrug transporter [Methylobacterium indicum]KTS42729.1 multidrug transporter [Methylobacterium indicum]KTS52325.1 multidrug transporter [Methylobacterium indicum]